MCVYRKRIDLHPFEVDEDGNVVADGEEEQEGLIDVDTPTSSNKQVLECGLGQKFKLWSSGGWVVSAKVLKKCLALNSNFEKKSSKNIIFS